MHKTVRDLWQFGREENLTLEDMLREKYRGIRPAPGYPACPDHTEKRTIFRLLNAEKATEMRLTETAMMEPPSSVCGLYFSHPKSRYFGIDRIARDQVEDYARRKGMKTREMERWLATHLGYDPDE